MKTQNIFSFTLLVRNCYCFNLNHYNKFTQRFNSKYDKFTNPTTNIKNFFSTNPSFNEMVKIKIEPIKVKPIKVEPIIETNNQHNTDIKDKYDTNSGIESKEKLQGENENLCESNKLQGENSYVEQVDTVVANSIDTLATGVNFTSSFLSHGIKYSGSMVGATLDGINNSIVKRLPRVANVKVPKIIKQTTATASDLSGYGKDMTKSTISSVETLGKAAGNAIGNSIKEVVPLPPTTANSISSSSKSFNSLKKLTSQTISGTQEVLNSVDKTTSDITNKIQNVGEQSITQVFGEDAGAISRDVFTTGKNLLDTAKIVKGVSTHKIVGKTVNAATKEAVVTYLKNGEIKKNSDIGSLGEQQQINHPTDKITSV